MILQYHLETIVLYKINQFEKYNLLDGILTF